MSWQLRLNFMGLNTLPPESEKNGEPRSAENGFWRSYKKSPCRRPTQCCFTTADTPNWVENSTRPLPPNVKTIYTKSGRPGAYLWNVKLTKRG